MESEELTIQEIIARKTTTEKRILGLIMAFEAETCLTVEDIVFIPKKPMPSNPDGTGELRYTEEYFKLKVSLEDLELELKRKEGLVKGGELTLQEIVQKKKNTEELILDLIRLFQIKTGLEVKDIMFRPGTKIHFPLFDGSEQCYIMPSFELKVRAEGLE